jgi:hypothetical protein
MKANSLEHARISKFPSQSFLLKKPDSTVRSHVNVPEVDMNVQELDMNVQELDMNVQELDMNVPEAATNLPTGPTAGTGSPGSKARLRCCPAPKPKRIRNKEI